MIISSMVKNGALLSAFALITTGIVALINAATAETIAEQEQLQLVRQFHEVLSPELYNNQLSEDCVVVTNDLLGPYKQQVIYRAKLNGKPVALVIRHITPNGYTGDINLLSAVYQNGEIAGVRVTKHQETPGLGDKVELKKSDWITTFKGTTVAAEDDPRWAVKKDGGQFDQFTGATITPRAVVSSVKNATLFAKSQFDALFLAPNACKKV
ncbi:electron transport complex subunit RsxG [Pseudoalteromonas sp. MMG010]|uniref:electron transport complex subunit RsxG n=1 Tax=Pseudoalteromonas sp. MMG010 TaxID=2822685 RepID=UPI001B39D264|nr:electron transport complex subunit RsxG [Pseudoalteromonas sp. MMG010]MBQ4833327.1 electron transport complex subunit RsxG [Pseudoalteromonas sp. MMG010]